MLLLLNTHNHRHLVRNYFHKSSSKLDLNHNFQNNLLTSFKDYYFNLIEYFENSMSFDIVEHKIQENYS